MMRGQQNFKLISACFSFKSVHPRCAFYQLELLKIQSQHKNLFYYFRLHGSSRKAIINLNTRMKEKCIHRVYGTDTSISHSLNCNVYVYNKRGRDSSVGIATRYGLDGPEIEFRWGEIFRTRPDRPWGPPSLLYNWCRVSFPGVERPRRGADHSPPSCAEVKKE
jgi:hypothetical protein